MNDPLRRNLLQALDSMFVRHNIDKIQIQYAAESQVLMAVLNNNAREGDSNIQYELVVKGKTTGRPKLYELTFSDKGELLGTSKIVLRNTDNLEY